MTTLQIVNLALILFGPFVAAGVVYALAQLATRDEKHAETSARAAEMQVRAAEREGGPR